MLPSGECPRHIAPAAAMVNKFVAKHKTLTKHNFKLAIIVLFYSKTFNISETQNEPSTQLINTTSCIKFWTALIQDEHTSYFSSYQMLTAEKFEKLLTSIEAC